jgi:hypothetical protein
VKLLCIVSIFAAAFAGYKVSSLLNPDNAIFVAVASAGFVALVFCFLFEYRLRVSENPPAIISTLRYPQAFDTLVAELRLIDFDGHTWSIVNSDPAAGYLAARFIEYDDEGTPSVILLYAAIQSVNRTKTRICLSFDMERAGTASEVAEFTVNILATVMANEN